MLNFDRVEEFWSFIREREFIRQRRLLGLPREQWTQDPIFQEFSFTNVKRDHDRTTMLLTREFYAPLGLNAVPHPSATALLNASIFRFVGTIEAARHLGWSPFWDPASFVAKMKSRMDAGATTFTPAYIVPSAGRSGPKHEVVAEFIGEIWKAANSPVDVVNPLKTNLWENASDRLCACFGVGSFMAKEILLDYMIATGWKPADWETWTPVGPGARRGAGYILTGEVAGIPEGEALSVIRLIYAERDEWWNSTHFYDDVTGETYDMPDLALTDIQFQFCELAKYVKVKLGVGRPKRKFRPTVDDVTKK